RGAALPRFGTAFRCARRRLVEPAACRRSADEVRVLDLHLVGMRHHRRMPLLARHVPQAMRPGDRGMLDRVIEKKERSTRHVCSGHAPVVLALQDSLRSANERNAMLLFDLGRTGVHMGAEILGGKHPSRFGIKCRFDGAFHAPGASAHFPLLSYEKLLRSEQDRGHNYYVSVFQGLVRRARTPFMVYCKPFRRSQTGRVGGGRAYKIVVVRISL